MVASASPLVHSQESAKQSALAPASSVLLRRALSGVHVLVAVAAFVGGVALVRDPTGTQIGLALSDLHGFGTFIVPGMLLVLLGVLQSFAAFQVLQPGARGLLVSQAGGAAITFFTAFGAALVTPLHLWQLATLLTGAVVYIVGHELFLHEPHEHMLP